MVFAFAGDSTITKFVFAILIPHSAAVGGTNRNENRPGGMGDFRHHHLLYEVRGDGLKFHYSVIFHTVLLHFQPDSGAKPLSALLRHKTLDLQDSQR